MSTSSTSDSYSAPTLIPSPQELSNLITDPYTNKQVDRKFRNKPTSSAILRYYTFIPIPSPNSKENWNDTSKNAKSYMTTCSLVKHSNTKSALSLKNTNTAAL